MSKILLVEDDLAVAALLEFMLRSEGHEVETWTSAFASIAELAPWDSIDAVVCDQDLGDGYDGKDLLHWIAAEHPQVRRIMITGSSLTDEEHAAAHKVLIKPFSSYAVQASLQEGT